MLKISVIIPVYNAGEFIRPTLDSMVNQTMKKEEFEVLAIDDLSTDNSVAVLNEYQEKLPNLRIIQRETNSGGPMVPRNDGLKLAQGEYIQFLDNDDYMGTEALQRLYDYAKENDSDVIFGRYKGVNGRGVPKSQFTKGNIAKADIIKNNLIYTIAPHKMFKTAMIREHQLDFEKNIRPGDEDKLFVMKAYLDAKVISVLSDYDYYYVVRRPGENLSLAKIPENPDLHFVAQRKIIDYLYEKNLSEARKQELKVAYINRLISFSILRASILAHKYPEATRRKYYDAARVFFQNYLTESDRKRLKPEHQLFVDEVLNGSFEEINELEEALKSISQDSHITVKNKAIYGEVSLSSGKKKIVDVTRFNTSKIRLYGVIPTTKYFLIDCSLKQKLLNGPIIMKLVERTTKKEILLAPNSVITADQSRGSFLVPYKKLTSGNIWDIFLISKTALPVERRLGKDRSFAALEVPVIPFKQVQLKPYFTKDFDNLSIQVK